MRQFNSCYDISCRLVQQLKTAGREGFPGAAELHCAALSESGAPARAPRPDEEQGTNAAQAAKIPWSCFPSSRVADVLLGRFISRCRFAEPSSGSSWGAVRDIALWIRNTHIQEVN